MLLPISLYVHWPFCLSKCPYCDFNSHVRENINQAAWQKSLLAEMAYVAKQTGPRKLVSIFFGGGTPSLMPPQTVGAVIDQATGLWDADDEIEITLEANPTSIEAQKFADYRAAGVNRVSMGIQALNDEDLHFLGRQHSVSEALAALDIAASQFDRFSFDLIYARPQQSVQAWEAELTQALSFGSDHLSLYQLTIEQGTKFAALHRQQKFTMPSEDLSADLYELTTQICTDAGLPPYEISNYAKSGQECRHNLVYWRMDDYVGIGPGAHGRLTLDGKRYATRAHRAPEIWLEKVNEDGHALTQTLIDQDEALTEALMMGMRLYEGVEMAPFNPILDMASLQRLKEGGYIYTTDKRISPTHQGMQCLDGVLAQLIR